MYNVPLDQLLRSSVWAQPYATRIVWITLLGQMDDAGFVPLKTIGAVAKRAQVSRAEAQAALAWLQSPDPDNQAQAHAGRRVEPCAGGWQVLEIDSCRQTFDDLCEACARWEGDWHV